MTKVQVKVQDAKGADPTIHALNLCREIVTRDYPDAHEWRAAIDAGLEHARRVTVPTRETTVPVAGLRRLLAEATARPWAYRSREYDDWGVVRGPNGFVVATARPGRVVDDLEFDAHRRAGTDPYGPNAVLIVAAVEWLPALLDIAEQHMKGGEANQSVRETRQRDSDKSTPALGTDGPERALPPIDRDAALRQAHEIVAGIGDPRWIEERIADALIEAAALPASEEVEGLEKRLETWLKPTLIDRVPASLEMCLRDVIVMLRRLSQPRQSEGVAKAINMLQMMRGLVCISQSEEATHWLNEALAALLSEETKPSRSFGPPDAGYYREESKS